MGRDVLLVGAAGTVGTGVTILRSAAVPAAPGLGIRQAVGLAAASCMSTG